MAPSATPNWKNRTLFHGDNLEMLRGMDTGTVHLIATDPPFNKGRDFHATPDSLASGASFQDRWSWKEDIHQKWIDQLEDDWPKAWSVIKGSRNSWGEDMGAFLCFMAVRLLEMHRVLRLDGSMYLHCDPTASHYLKGLMDAIFDRNNFRSEIVWNRSAENLSRKKWRRGAETILYYSKSRDWVWNEQFQPLDEKRVATDYRYEDEDGRYTTTSCTNNAYRPNMIYEFNGNKRQWRYSKETMLRYEHDGLLVYNKDGVPRRKRYLSEVLGTRLTNVWSDINVLASNARCAIQ